MKGFIAYIYHLYKEVGELNDSVLVLVVLWEVVSFGCNSGKMDEPKDLWVTHTQLTRIGLCEGQGELRQFGCRWE